MATEKPMERKTCLSPDNLKPQEVIDQGLVQMSLSTLYRAVDDGRFYAVIPRGSHNGRTLPAWQFHESVSEFLPEIIKALREAGEQVHRFMVTECDEFNELSPAEYLAGVIFNTRRRYEDCQVRLLERSPRSRYEHILTLIRQVNYINKQERR